jgi:RNA polymerase sigma-70 factor (ECF subfamily)
MNDTPLSLLDRLRRQPDDQLSWRRLTLLYEPLIRRWLLQHSTPDADADDLQQEVLLVLTRELSVFDHNGRSGAFRHWVRSITANRLRDFWRSRQSAAINGLDESLAQFADPVSEIGRIYDREHDEFIMRRLMELIEPEFSPSTWKSFQFLAFDEKSASEVASQLGLTVNAVLIAKSRVLRRLRQEGRGLID